MRHGVPARPRRAPPARRIAYNREPSMPKVTVNGKQMEVAAGTRVIAAARTAGVEVPHFCYHPELSTPANCRMCLVAQKGQRRLIPACSTIVADGMEIDTEHPEAKDNRRSVMEFLLINHPLDCPTCDEAGECRLQNYTQSYRVTDSRFTERKVTKTITNLSENVQFWGNRCIACTRCVRFTNEITGTGELGLFERGSHNEIGVFPGKILDNPLSMNVVDVCPVGALLARDYMHKTRFWFLKSTVTTCASCAKGCAVHVDTWRGEIQRLLPRENPLVNGPWMCDAGRLNYPYTHARNRLKRPMVRKGGQLVEVSWEEAVSTAVEGLRRHGAPAGRGSAWATCEEAFLLKAFVEGLGGAVTGFSALPDGKEVVLPKFTIPADKNPNRRGAAANLSISGAMSSTKAAHVLAGIPGYVLTVEEKKWASSLDFLSVQEIASSGWTEFAHVLLPGASPFEKSGTFVNDKEMRQDLAAAIPPPDGAREDWQILLDLAAAAGLGLPWKTLEDVKGAVPAAAAK